MSSTSWILRASLGADVDQEYAVIGIRYRSDVYFEAALLIALFGFVSSVSLAKFLLRGEVIE